MQESYVAPAPHVPQRALDEPFQLVTRTDREGHHRTETRGSSAYSQCLERDDNDVGATRSGPRLQRRTRAERLSPAPGSESLAKTTREAGA